MRGKYNVDNKSWSQAMDEVRAERLIENYEKNDSDLCFNPLLVLLKKWPSSNKYKDKTRLLENQVNCAVYMYYICLESLV